MPGPDVVVGASSGLGAALALHLGSGGRPLVMAARREDRLREVAAAISGGAVRARCIGVDLRLQDQAAGLADALSEQGVVSTLYLVAAANEPPLSITDAVAHQCEVSNYVRLLFSGWVTLVASLERNRCLSDSSRVVAISSIAGGVPFAALPLYGAGKAALEHWMRAQRRPDGPRYIVVRPGRFDSEFFGAVGTRAELPLELAAAIVNQVEAGKNEIYLGGRRDRLASRAQRTAQLLAQFIVKDASPERTDG